MMKRKRPYSQMLVIASAVLALAMGPDGARAQDGRLKGRSSCYSLWALKLFRLVVR